MCLYKIAMYKQFILDKEGRQDNGPKQEWQGGCLGRLSTIGNIHRLNLNQVHLVIRSNISNQAQPTNLQDFYSNPYCSCPFGGLSLNLSGEVRSVRFKSEPDPFILVGWKYNGYLNTWFTSLGLFWVVEDQVRKGLEMPALNQGYFWQQNLKKRKKIFPFCKTMNKWITHVWQL